MYRALPGCQLQVQNQPAESSGAPDYDYTAKHNNNNNNNNNQNKNPDYFNYHPVTTTTTVRKFYTHGPIPAANPGNQTVDTAGVVPPPIVQPAPKVQPSVVAPAKPPANQNPVVPPNQIQPPIKKREIVKRSFDYTSVNDITGSDYNDAIENNGAMDPLIYAQNKVLALECAFQKAVNPAPPRSDKHSSETGKGSSETNGNSPWSAFRSSKTKSDANQNQDENLVVICIISTLVSLTALKL